MTIEPPLISPQPFPLTPRPMSPPTRFRPSLAEVLPPTRRPTPEEKSESPAVYSRSNTPVGSIKSNTVGSLTPRRPTLEIRPDSPANRPRPTGAPLRRPTLEEYGNIRINTTASVANRLPRTGPDEYDTRLNRTESPIMTDSPILKNVRSVFSPDQMSDGLSSTDTSRSSSPVHHYHSVFSPPPPANKPLPPRPVRSDWHLGPAPTAPPTTPLPIPEKNMRRKNTIDATPAAPPKQQPEQPRSPPAGPIPTSPSPPPAPSSSGLASSASIVPDMFSNPNWPLPGPGSTYAASIASEGSFSARRSLLPDRRAPPAPLNIAATKYAEDMGCGADAGPLSQSEDEDSDEDGDGASRFSPIGRLGTGGGGGGQMEIPIRKASMIRIDTDFTWKEERTTMYKTAESSDEEDEDEEENDNDDNDDHYDHHGGAVVAEQPGPYVMEDKSSAIGVARGLSLKYDKMREQEKRARVRERMKTMKGWAIEESTIQASPPGGNDMLIRSNRALISPTGIADEHGTGFI